MTRWFLLMLAAAICAACGDPAGEPGDSERRTSPAPTREEWWSSATLHPSSRERILSPREMRALLAEGRGYGFDSDPGWWNERRLWVFQRVLEVDLEDIEANAATGRKTLQEIDGFAPLWERMILATVRNEAIEELLDRYDELLQDERAIFLTADEYEVVIARLREARAHLERLENDARYSSLERLLARVRNSVLGDYPSIHIVSGPFVIFYAARDLQVIEGEDPEAEERRLEPLRELYATRLEARRTLYVELLEDIRKRYPKLWAKRAPGEGQLFLQWIFSDRSLYQGCIDRLPLREPSRGAFVHDATNWAYLYESSVAGGTDETEARRQEAAGERALLATAARLAAEQLLREWGKDPKDPLVNHMETSPDYWLKVGWPAWIASQRFEDAALGSEIPKALARAAGLAATAEAARKAWRANKTESNLAAATAAENEALRAAVPPLVEVIERRSRLDRRAVLRTESGADIYVDLAWALVGQLNSERYDSAFERYLLSQIEGSQRGIAWFEECFGVEGLTGWRDLQRAVYARADDDQKTSNDKTSNDK